ncbi:protein FAM227B-like isoform X2 [Oscarella lobularis]|uniref:protein FAM227B-like isoform X2 n=1 Tax=Oscarella lobularis TaxID=121494 RepID=UPI003313C6C6
MFGRFQAEETTTGGKKETILPPKSSEEWLERTNQPNWPDRVDGEDPPSLSWDFSSINELREDLRRHAPLDITIMEEVESQLLEIEKHLMEITDHIVETRERPSMAISTVTGGLRNAPHPIFLTELYDHAVVASRQPTLQKQARETSGRSVETFVYPGFKEDELTPLPAQLESPQVLVHVSNSQSFKSGFRKLWQRLFVSEASLALLQDAFWWSYLDRFQPQSCGVEKAKLFGRIADSFVALFSAVKPDFKDKFFKHYADCMAQAIFSTFCQAFPGSRASFHTDDFKDYLANLLSEWMTGIRLPPRSWLHWNVNQLDPGYLPEIGGESQFPAPRTSSQNDSLRKLTQKGSRLSFDLGGPSFDHVPGLHRQSTRRSLAQSSPLAELAFQEESHPIGHGALCERVLFDTKGRSPLVTQYLQSKQLLAEGALPRDSMTRTQIAKLPSPGPTYKDFIRHAKKVSNKLNNEFNREHAAFMAEEKRIRREKRRLDSEFKKVTEEIMSRQHEVKMLSERLMGVISSGGKFAVGSVLADLADPLGLSETSLVSAAKGGNSERDSAASVMGTNESPTSRTVSRSASRLSMMSDFK